MHLLVQLFYEFLLLSLRHLLIVICSTFIVNEAFDFLECRASKVRRLRCRLFGNISDTLGGRLAHVCHSFSCFLSHFANAFRCVCSYSRKSTEPAFIFNFGETPAAAT